MTTRIRHNGQEFEITPDQWTLPDTSGVRTFDDDKQADEHVLAWLIEHDSPDWMWRAVGLEPPARGRVKL